jgi:NAD(P)H-dependent FMN reductase
MTQISIISSSVRDGRKSHRVALYLKDFINEHDLAHTEILDLKDFNFPIFLERLRLQKDPTDLMYDFADKIKESDGIIIVTPEYNGSIPASLKNVIDFLYDEWHHKPIAIATVSSGDFGGSQALTSLQFTLWKMHAFTVSKVFQVGNVNEKFNESGSAIDSKESDKQANILLDELLWYMEANKRMLEPVTENAQLN